MDIQVKEFQAPKVVINYEELKEELEKSLKEYEGLIVTAETLSGCKDAQKELASLRVKIDNYRKDKKKELEKPIKSFEAQCKELIALVESVEKPIKDGIKVFDDQKREEKRLKAVELAAEVAAAVELNEKYAAQLTVIEKYMNLTATVKAVREDLETRAFALKLEQDKEAERIDIIKSVLDSENSRLKTKIQLSMWQRDIDADRPTSDIITSIKAQAALVYEAENTPVEPENKPVEPEKVIKETHIPPQIEKAENEAQTQPDRQLFKVTFDVIGDYETQHKVSDFLKANGITYNVVKQLKI